MYAPKFPAPGRRLLRGLVMVAALLATSLAQALSIGEIELKSRLGEPLRASVSLGHIGKLSESQIIVGRASDDVHEAFGMDRASTDTPLNFALMVDAKGYASVAITTKDPLNEPMVDMVLEVRWPNGRAVKQFTLLLDLPSR